MRKPETAVELVKITVPLLAEAVVVAFAIAIAGLWLGIWGGAI